MRACIVIRANASLICVLFPPKNLLELLSVSTSGAAYVRVWLADAAACGPDRRRVADYADICRGVVGPRGRGDGSWCSFWPRDGMMCATVSSLVVTPMIQSAGYLIGAMTMTKPTVARRDRQRVSDENARVVAQLPDLLGQLGRVETKISKSSPWRPSRPSNGSSFWPQDTKTSQDDPAYSITWMRKSLNGLRRHRNDDIDPSSADLHSPSSMAMRADGARQGASGASVENKERVRGGRMT